MKKKNVELKCTTDTHVYTRVRILLVTGCCLKCKKRHRTDLKSWKNYRQHQWKDN